MDWFNKIKNFFFGERNYGYALSPRGECMLEYCRRIVNGQEDYIESYEQELREFANKNKLSRSTAAIAYVEILENIKKTGCI